MSPEGAQPPADPVRPSALAVELCVLALPAVLLLTAVYFVWMGVLRFAALCSLGLAAWLCGSGRLRLRPVLGTGKTTLLLGLAVAAMFVEQASLFVVTMARGHECFTDMGRPSICAGEWLLVGKNPWAECLPKGFRAEAEQAPDTLDWCLEEGRCVDRKSGGSYRRWKQDREGIEFVHGYKYGPLLAATYLPATHGLREAGLDLVNLLFWLLQLGLVGWLGARAFPTLPRAGLRALFVFLLPSALPARWLYPAKWQFEFAGRPYELLAPSRFAFVRELTVNCANDVLPLSLALLALAFATRRRALAAGVVLGLSLAMKQLPALLLWPLLARLEGVCWKRLSAGALLIATALYLPFFLWAPEEMFGNLVQFQLERPANRSSLQRYLPRDARGFISALQWLLTAALLVRFARRPAHARDLAALVHTAALALLGFVALNKVVHGNYLLWIQPFTALSFAGLPFARPRPTAGAAG